MIERLASFLRVDDRGEITLISGTMPAEAAVKTLRDALQARPAARRCGEGMAVTIPVAEAEWYVWILETVPTVTELAALMPRLQELSKGIRAGLVAASPAIPAPSVAAGMTEARSAAPAGDPSLVARLNAKIGDAAAPDAEALARIVMDDLVAQGKVAGAAFLRWTAGGRRKLWLSDLRYRGQTDQIGAIAEATRGDARRAETVRADKADDATLELAMLARQCEAPNLGFVLPPRGASGYGIMGFGLREDAQPSLEAAVDLLSFAARVPSVDVGKRRFRRRAVLAAAAAALAVFLAWPTPMIISTTGSTLGADVTVAALPSEAYLKRMAVRVGDTVKQGDLIGEFFSPAIEDAMAETELSASIERLNAQNALAENDYAAYQLAAQRFEIGKKQLENLARRKEALTILAPASGRVIAAIPSTMTGKYTPVGEPAASIQTTSDMLVEISLSRMDARLVSQGMTGTVYFRGLGGETFPVEVITPATVSYRPDTGEEVITALARVTSGDLDQLIVGMAGFARLEGGTVPRIVSYGRYAGEFVREKAWTYLGLNF